MVKIVCHIFVYYLCRYLIYLFFKLQLSLITTCSQILVVFPEKPPSLPKLAERKLINAVLGEAIRLPCPGASAMLPVSWQFEGSKPGSPLQPLLRHEINIEGASVYATFIDIANDLYLESVSVRCSKAMMSTMSTASYHNDYCLYLRGDVLLFIICFTVGK